MNRFFDILSALSKSRTVVYPAVIGFVTAGVHMIGMSHDVERKVLHFVDSSFGLLGAGVFVWGVMADMQNARTKTELAQAKQSTNENKQAIADTNTTATVAATAAVKLTEVVNANTAVIDPLNPTPSTTPLQYIVPPPFVPIPSDKEKSP